MHRIKVTKAILNHGEQRYKVHLHISRMVDSWSLHAWAPTALGLSDHMAHLMQIPILLTIQMVYPIKYLVYFIANINTSKKVHMGRPRKIIFFIATFPQVMSCCRTRASSRGVTWNRPNKERLTPSSMTSINFSHFHQEGFDLGQKFKRWMDINCFEINYDYVGHTK